MLRGIDRRAETIRVFDEDLSLKCFSIARDVIIKTRGRISHSFVVYEEKRGWLIALFNNRSVGFVSGWRWRTHSCCCFEGLGGEEILLRTYVWFNDPLWCCFITFSLSDHQWIIINSLLFIQFFLEFPLSYEVLEKIPRNSLETGKSPLSIYLSSVPN